MAVLVATLISPSVSSTHFVGEFEALCVAGGASWLGSTVLVSGLAQPGFADNVAVVEAQLSVASESVTSEMAAFAATFGRGFSVAVQRASVFRSRKRLAVFDMDSTLIQQEVIDEIARCRGVVHRVAEITESAMNGEIDFRESLARRVSLLKGAPVTVLDEVKRKITFTPGARELCKVLKRLGYTLAVISGGFLPLANYVKNELGLDFAYANQLSVSPDGTTLTGTTHGPIVDAARKAELLDVLAQSLHISRDQVLAVGDGANDLPMLAAAGLGVAFNAKPRVQEQARVVLNQPSLIYVLVLLGLTGKEIQEVLSAE